MFKSTRNEIIQSSNLNQNSKTDSTMLPQESLRAMQDRTKLNKSMSKFMTKFTINPLNRSIFKKIDLTDENDINDASSSIKTNRNYVTLDKNREVLSTLFLNSSQTNLWLETY